VVPLSDDFFDFLQGSGDGPGEVSSVGRKSDLIPVRQYEDTSLIYCELTIPDYLFGFGSLIKRERSAPYCRNRQVLEMCSGGVKSPCNFSLRTPVLRGSLLMVPAPLRVVVGFAASIAP